MIFHRHFPGTKDKRIFEMKKQSGFTLIELMIVVAIVAILAAVALPAYQNYTKKAKMTELVSATSAQKLAIEVCVQGNGEATCTPGSNGILGSTPSGASAAVPSVTVDKAAGVYTIKARAVAAQTPLKAGETFELTSSDTTAAGTSISWTGKCYEADGTTAQTDYCPAK